MIAAGVYTNACMLPLIAGSATTANKDTRPVANRTCFWVATIWMVLRLNM